MYFFANFVYWKKCFKLSFTIIRWDGIKTEKCVRDDKGEAYMKTTTLKNALQITCKYTHSGVNTEMVFSPLAIMLAICYLFVVFLYATLNHWYSSLHNIEESNYQVNISTVTITQVCFHTHLLFMMPKC